MREPVHAADDSRWRPLEPAASGGIALHPMDDRMQPVGQRITFVLLRDEMGGLPVAALRETDGFEEHGATHGCADPAGFSTGESGRRDQSSNEPS